MGRLIVDLKRDKPHWGAQMGIATGTRCPRLAKYPPNRLSGKRLTVAVKHKSPSSNA